MVSHLCNAHFVILVNSDRNTRKYSIIQLDSESEIDDYYDNLSSSIQNYVWYRRIASHYVSHTTLGGGTFVVEGFKTSNNFEIQSAMTYRSNGMRHYTRIKYSGVWTSWAVK